jgi:hypothetical protein
VVPHVVLLMCLDVLVGRIIVRDITRCFETVLRIVMALRDFSWFPQLGASDS